MFINYGPAVLILFSIFFGIFMNRRDYSLLREDMNRRFSELKADLSTKFAEIDRRLALIEADQKQFFKETGEIYGRLNELSRTRLRNVRLLAFAGRLQVPSATP